MPDIYGFNHLPNWGAITVQCIEDGCNAGGTLGDWSERKREEHYLTHLVAIKEAAKTVTVCIDCGEEFLQERRRGAPRIRCDKCREIAKQHQLDAYKKEPTYKISRTGFRLDECVICGKEFEQEIKRGKPWKKCEECR